MTRTSPSRYLRLFTASNASSSRSKQRAGPVNFKPDMPATLTMAPSGARLPFRPTTPPVGGTDHVLPRIPFHAAQVLGDRAAGDGHAVAVQVAVVEQGFHQERHAAG